MIFVVSIVCFFIIACVISVFSFSTIYDIMSFYASNWCIGLSASVQPYK